MVYSPTFVFAGESGNQPASQLDTNFTGAFAGINNAFLVGALASRPAPDGVGNGRYYYATDTGQFYRDNGSAWVLLSTIATAPQAGRLQFVSGTSIKFNPYNGGRIRVAGTDFDIPSSGIASGNPTTTSNFVNGTASQALAASTTYLVCVFNNSGTLTLDFISGASAAVPGTHAADTAAGNVGVEIKTQGGADTTRTVVGMIRTNATPNFQADSGLQGVLSWFNRRDIGLTNRFTADRTTTNNGYVELNTEIRANFITWGDEAVLASISGSWKTGTAGSGAFTSFGFDGATAENTFNQFTEAVISDFYPLGLTMYKNGLAEGFHDCRLLGSSDGVNTATWVGGAQGFGTALTVAIRG